MAECEFSVLSRQCLNRRVPDIDTVSKEVAAWTANRNDNRKPAQWRFTTKDARIKLRENRDTHQLIVIQVRCCRVMQAMCIIEEDYQMEDRLHMSIVGHPHHNSPIP